MAWVAPSSRSTGDLITAAIWNQDIVNNPTALLPSALEFFIDGGGGTISTGVAGWLRVPYKCDISSVDLTSVTVSGSSGGIIIDIWRDTYANYPPTVADTIVASAKPTIASAIKAQDSTLTGWTLALANGDYLYFNVDGASILQRCLIALAVNRS